MTRRHFAAVLPAAAALAQETPAPLTAKQVIEKIRQNLGVEWREPTVDTIKAGNPDAPVKGIATTVMATLDVLQRAAAKGRNLVITHEPTFYNHEDKTQDFEKDPVYQAKQDLIAKNNMVVFRFHDNWHATGRTWCSRVWRRSWGSSARSRTRVSSKFPPLRSTN